MEKEHILLAGQQRVSHCTPRCLGTDVWVPWAWHVSHRDQARAWHGLSLWEETWKLDFNSTGLINLSHIYSPVTARYLCKYLVSWITCHLSTLFSCTSKVEMEGQQEEKKHKPEKNLRIQKLLQKGDYFEMFSMKILTLFTGPSECTKQNCCVLVLLLHSACSQGQV